MPWRTAAQRAVRGMRLVARHALPNMTNSVLLVPPFLRAAVDWALCSQFWADFAKTEICHGARTRRWRRSITSSSRARRSMLPKASSASLYDRPDSGRFLLPGLLEDRALHVYTRTCTRGTC